MKNFIKKNKLELLAFFLPVFAIVLISIGDRIWPFGENCMLHIDMYHQYCPFFTELAAKLKAGDSLMYTWNLGLGSDYVSLYAYYLSSPLNLLLLLCPSSAVIEFMEIMITLKIGLCGLSMYLFLKYHMDFSNRVAVKKAALVFASAYAMCGFVAAYSWDIMWMDAVALTPLVLLGLERLVKENRVKLYTVTLALAIWSNYYISIMLCIFLVFYFAWLFFTETKGAKQKAQSVLRFGIYSLLAGGLSAILILPEIAVLSYSGSSMGKGFPEAMEWYFNVMGVLSRTTFASDVYTGTSHWPNLYCGIFCMLLMFLYGFNRRIPLKCKIPAYGMVAFMLVSFANNYLDFVWHGFHFPESLPGRQSYLFAFLIITMAFHAWCEREVFKYWHFAAASVLYVLLMATAWLFDDPEITEPIYYGLSALFLMIYLVLYAVRKRFRIMEILFMVAFGELCLNMALTGIGVTSRTAYTENDSDYDALIAYANEQEDGDFYRLEDLERTTKNDSSRHTYSSTTVFSSLMNLDVSHFYQSVYMEGGKNYYCYNGATPITGAMLSVDYVISEDELPESEYRTLVKTSGRLKLYENTYSLPVGFMLSENVIENWDNEYSNSTDKVSNLNELAELLGASEHYLRETAAKSEVSAGATSITIPEDGYYYAGYVNNSGDRLKMETSSGYKRTFSKTTHRYLLEIGQCKAGDVITFTNYKEEEVKYRLYALSSSAVEQVYDTLAEETFTVTGYTSTSMSGKITTEGGRLIFSIPYVPGWTVKVDGKTVEPIAYEEAFLSVSLEPGTHQISLSYKTPYLGMGAAISALCIGVFVLLLLFRRFVLCERQSAS